MGVYDIRLFGDPVLRQRASNVDEIDASLARLAGDMVDTMRKARGAGLAAPQVGVQRRVFVYDIGDGPRTVVNPRIEESSGEWTYEEGCLSVPGMSWPIVRPKQVRLVGYDVEGKAIDIDADELLARVFQHELDHLDGILLLERLKEDQRRDALRLLRARTLQLPGEGLESGTTVSGM